MSTNQILTSYFLFMLFSIVLFGIRNQSLHDLYGFYFPTNIFVIFLNLFFSVLLFTKKYWLLGGNLWWRVDLKMFTKNNFFSVNSKYTHEKLGKWSQFSELPWKFKFFSFWYTVLPLRSFWIIHGEIKVVKAVSFCTFNHPILWSLVWTTVVVWASILKFSWREYEFWFCLKWSFIIIGLTIQALPLRRLSQRWRWWRRVQRWWCRQYVQFILILISNVIFENFVTIVIILLLLRVCRFGRFCPSAA